VRPMSSLSDSLKDWKRFRRTTDSTPARYYVLPALAVK
jgi:hypothetical protein